MGYTSDESLQVCFDKKLFLGTDAASVAYQVDALKLSGGQAIDPANPCVNENSIPPSFTLNNLDPKNPEHLRDYLTHVPHFQTVACFREVSRRFANDFLRYKEKDYERVYVDPALWASDPSQVVDSLNHINYSNAMSTETYLFTDLPFGDAQAEAFTNHSARAWDCREFAKAKIYYDSMDDPRVRELRAESVLESYKEHRQDSMWGIKAEEPSPLNPELNRTLYPIFRDLREITEDHNTRKTATRAMSQTGGEDALEYLTFAILSGNTKGFDEDAARELLYAARQNFDKAFPYLERVLMDESENSRKARERILTSAMDGLVPYDSRLLPAFDHFIRNAFQKNLTNDIHLYCSSLLMYFRECGSDAIPYLVSYATGTDVKFEESFRNEAIVSLGTIDDPLAAGELKTIALANNGRLNAIALGVLGRGNTKAAREATLELLSAQCSKSPLLTLDGQNFVVSPFASQLSYSISGAGVDNEAAYQYFKFLSSDKCQRDFGGKREIAFQHHRFFLRRFNDFNKDEQLYLFGQWMAYQPNALDTALWMYAHIKLNPKTDKAYKDEVDKHVINEIGRMNRFGELGRAFAVSLSTVLKEGFIPPAVKDGILEKQVAQFGELSDSSHFQEAANDPKVDKIWRRKAILALAKLPTPDVNDVLRNKYILNDGIEPFLREAATDALAMRAKIPAFREGAVATIKKCLCPPDSVQKTLRDALKAADDGKLTQKR